MGIALPPAWCVAITTNHSPASPSVRSERWGYRHQRDDILGAALTVATAEGLSSLTYGRVAKQLGISDRIVVYYFPSKEALLGAVLAALGERLQATLAGALAAPAADHLALARAAWPVMATADNDPTFALFFEALGLASSGREPYRSALPAFIEAWIAWTAERLSGTAARRRAEAEAALALLDGLLLLRQVAGPEAGARAAKRLGL